MNPNRTSKLLSLVLRHKPETIGVELDSNGWVDIDELLEALRTHDHTITREQLVEIVETNDKQRFVVEGNRIRANQGHSIRVDLDLERRSPPSVLFHGTATRFLEPIGELGLLKMNRQHVHLSRDIPTASRVGVRHGKLVVLEIASGDMARDGHSFFCSLNGVWLVDHVPPGYIRMPAVDP